MAIRVALAGATGNLGPSILSALLAASFHVTILTRQSSTHTIPPHPNQRIVQVDYDSQPSLITALKGHSVLISTLSGHSPHPQNTLSTAAASAGITRIIPSEFGSDLTHPINRSMPAFASKLQVHEHIQQIANDNPGFTYTYITTNAFLDWGFKAGFFADIASRKFSVFDGGEHPVSLTTLDTVGKAVVGVINNLEATRNRTVFVHDIAISMNDFKALVEKVDGREWSADCKDTRELYDQAVGEMGKEKPDMRRALVGQVYRAAFGRDTAPDWNIGGRCDNGVLGLEEREGSEALVFVEGVVRGALQG